VGIFEDKECGEALQSGCSLCIGELLKRVATRALPILPRLMAVCGERLNASSLAVMISVVESLPNFVGPYVGGLLKVEGLLGLGGVHSGGNEKKEGEVMEVEEGVIEGLNAKLLRKIAGDVKIRILLEHYLGVVEMCVEKDAWRELGTAFQVFGLAVGGATRAELASFVLVITDGLLKAYDGVVGGAGGASGETEQLLLASINEFLVAVVMKGNEKQLKKIWTKIVIWNEQDEEDRMEKNIVTWSAASILSKELRGIFLGCMNLSFAEGVSILDKGVNFGKKKSDKKRGRKNARGGGVGGGVGGGGDGRGEKLVRVVLEAMTNCFRSDAEVSASASASESASVHLNVMWNRNLPYSFHFARRRREEIGSRTTRRAGISTR